MKSSGAEKFIQIPLGIKMDEVERIVIQENLVNNNGNKSKTADILGIGRKTLHRKLDEWEAEVNNTTEESDSESDI